MESIVALDIETTGLDTENDAIIEIGAVRFKDHRVESEFSTLISPGRRIPPFITNLTGITDQMVRQSPTIHEVLPDLVAFVGDAPIVGHNVRFDLSFFQRYRALRENTAIDTYEMAAVLLPNAGRYNLASLAQALGVPYQATHRALDDAKATYGVYLRLSEEVMQLPMPLLAELLQLADKVDWLGYYPLRMAMRARSRELVSPEVIKNSHQGPLFEEKNTRQYAPLQQHDTLTALDPQEVATILEPGGLFSHHFPHFEHRSQQVEMLRAVTQALSESHHLLVEAGTGTGKSMAYLIPAALWSMQNDCRVVISTNTINLQDQLINKDIPDLSKALGINLRASVLKGRGNYLCPRRLENLRRHGPENADEMRVLGKALVWLQGTHTGDRSEINLNGPVERQIWMRMSAEDENCTMENCLKHTGGACPFYRARQAAQSAHLLIVNHALLLSDVATGNRVLPDYSYLIIDEGHHLEDASTNALSYRVTQVDIERLLRQLGGARTGLLGWTLKATEGTLSPSDTAAIHNLVGRITDTAFRFQSQNLKFFTSVGQFLSFQNEGKPEQLYARQERIVPATRTQPAWEKVEVAWEEAVKSLQPLLEQIEQLYQGLAEQLENLADEDQELYGSLSGVFRTLKEYGQQMSGLVFEPDFSQIYWTEVQASGFQISLHIAPLHIGDLMERYLWHEKSSVILTSATLTTAGEFTYLRGRLNADDADELALGSPFDFETAALLYLISDIPEPSDRNGHQRAVENALIRLCPATEGKTLVLFTSYDQLKRTAQAMSPLLSKNEIMIFEQGDGASPHTLLENFRSTEKAVLLGTRAFWEGVDVPGEALSVLVIVKLPFDVPSDPIIAARSETFEDPFTEYSLPEAILRFRQGFGRLIRTQTDRGMVVVLDRRIMSKRYGKLFLNSLPPCTVRTGKMEDLPREAQKWLNL